MMGIVMPEICWAYKKYNKIISGIQLVFYPSGNLILCIPLNSPKHLLSCHLPSHVVVPNDDNDDKDVGSSSQD